MFKSDPGSCVMQRKSRFALALLVGAIGAHASTSTAQAREDALRKLTILSAVQKNDFAYAAVQELMRGAKVVLGTSPLVQHEVSGVDGTKNAIQMLKEGHADIAVLELASIADKPILHYSRQPFLSKDAEAARRLDLWMRRDIARILEQDLSLRLLGTVPQSPEILLSTLKSWDGSFSNSRVLVSSPLDATNFARLGVLGVDVMPSPGVAARLSKGGLVFAVLPLPAALNVARQSKAIYAYDQRVAFPVAAMLVAKDGPKGYDEKGRQAIATLANGIEDLAWSRLNSYAQRAFERAKDEVAVGELRPGAADNYSKLLVTSISTNARFSVSEMVAAHSQKQAQMMRSSGDEQVYGRYCRNLEILFVTNRAIRPAPGGLPFVLPRRGDEVTGALDTQTHFGVIKVQVSGRSFDPKLTLGKCTDANGREISDQGFTLHEVHLLSQADFVKVASQNTLGFSAESPFLGFIHGYRVSFRDAVETIAQLSVRLRHKLRPVLVTWPSAGELFDYGGDGERAAQSGPLVSTAIETLEIAKPARSVNLVAHSMGNRVALNGLLALAATPGYSGKRNLNELVTVAPDVQCDRYRDAITRMQAPSGQDKPLFRRSTLYLYENDYALAWARRYWTFRDPKERCRMGSQRGPAAPSLAALEPIDWSCMKDTVDSHSYYVQSDYISRDLRDTVASQSTPLDRDLERIDVQGSGPYFLQPAAVIRNCPPPS